MIDWYVDLDEGRHYNLKNDRYLKSVIETTTTPFMNYFVKRLNQSLYNIHIMFFTYND